MYGIFFTYTYTCEMLVWPVITVTTLEIYSTLPGGELLKYNKWPDFLFLKSLYQFLSIVIFVTDKLLVND